MEHEYKVEQLPSGKHITRHFGTDGIIADETHYYGVGPMEIGIRIDFIAGAKVDETYFGGKGLISRRTYEKRRINYEDMPVADSTLKDGIARLRKIVREERRQRNEQPKQRLPNPEEALKNDEFCSSVMAKGKREDAVQWIQTKSHTLGERNWSSSKRLLERLTALGCVQIHACEIDNCGDSDENAGHLVVELPTTKDDRL